MTEDAISSGWMHEVLRDVWVGQWEAADCLVSTHQSGWDIICTLENPRGNDRRSETTCLPTLESRPGQGAEGAPADWVASARTLDRIGRRIDRSLNEGKKVLVHCGAGMERSPLAVAWWLRGKLGIGLDEAYRRVRAARAQTLDRRTWLAPELRRELPSEVETDEKGNAS